jgi:hypothetical protein
MSTTRAFYSVVQYVPDPGRAEAANAGVVLFVPSTNRIETRFSPTLARVRRFFALKSQDVPRVELSLKSLKHRLEIAQGEFEDEPGFARFIAARADAVQLTRPRLVMIGDPLVEIRALYDELVGDPDLTTRVLKLGHTLPPKLAEVFGRLEAAKKIWRPGRITVPTIRRRFEVTAAYRNGLTNYIRSESLTTKGDRLSKLGFNGRLIAEHPVNGEKSRLVVVSTNATVDPKDDTHFRDVLDDFGVRYVPYSDANRFAEEVEQSAH